MKKEVIKGMKLDVQVTIDGKLVSARTLMLNQTYHVPVCLMKDLIVGMLTTYANNLTEQDIRKGLCGLIHTTEEKDC